MARKKLPDLDALRRELERIGSALPRSGRGWKSRLDEHEILDLLARVLVDHPAPEGRWLETLAARVRRLTDRAGLERTKAAPVERPSARPKRGRAVDSGQRAAAIEAALATYRPFLDAEREARGDDLPPLPVLEARSRIVEAIGRHDVLLLVGETGSGKTLLSPFFALEAGLGRRAGILQTQPRRVAARQIASRLAEMSGTEPGALFGCHTRVDKDFGPSTVVKIATDGIVLQELRGDPLLRRYDMLIVDEAHERSLNIDLLLGMLHRIRSQRPDLKILVSSATLETERFKAFWNLGDDQVIEVPGRLHEVVVEYRDPADDSDLDDEDVDDLPKRAALEVGRIVAGGGPGDLLVFMPRVREIQSTIRLVEGMRLPNVVALPMHGRQDPEDNQRCLRPHPDRKVVVATNIAETSLTVEGVRFVIDSGLVNEKRYDPKTGITSLLPRPASLAAARQRAGRAGRLEAGWAIRLWPEDENDQRRADTQPEILRSDLANLVLTMKMLGIDDVLGFPFLTRPDSKRFYDARQTLIDLGALTTGDHAITEMGRRMAELPLDPHLSRMVLAAIDRDVLPAVLSVAAALSMDADPFRPPPAGGMPGLAAAHRREVDGARRQLAGPDGSDYDLLRQIVDGYRHRKWKERRKWAETHRLRLRTLEEMLSIRRDLVDALRDRGLKVPKGEPDGAVDREAFHQAILSGLVQNVAVRTEGFAYQYAATNEIYIHPSSVLFGRKNRPQLIVCASIVEGENRTFGRHVAPISIAWLERLAPHLIGYTHRQKRYDPDRGRVLALENVYFRQLTLAEDREIDLHLRSPDEALRMLVADGLLADRMELGLEWHRANETVLEEVRQLAERIGKPDLAPDEEGVIDFYARKLAGCKDRRDVVRIVGRRPEKTLGMSIEDFLGPEDLAAARALFPVEVEIGGETWPVEYLHDPWRHRTRATVTVDLAAARRLTPAAIETLVPGLALRQLEALATAWNEAGGQPPVEAGHVARIAGAWRADDPIDLATLFARHVGRPVPDAVAEEAARAIDEGHLAPWLRVLDDDGEEICCERGIDALRRAIDRGELSKAWEEARHRHETDPTPRYQEVPGLFADLARPVTVAAGVEGFVGLDHIAGGFARRLFKEPADARAATRRALAEFLRLRLALRPAEREGLEGDLISPELERRFFKRTGRTSLAADVRALLWRHAAGGSIDLADLGRPDAVARLEAARVEAVDLARRLPDLLDSLLGSISTLRKRLDKGEAQLARTPELEDLFHRAVERLRDLEDLSPADLEALDRELSDGKKAARGPA